MLITTTTVNALQSEMRRTNRFIRSRRNVAQWLHREIAPAALGRPVAAR